MTEVSQLVDRFDGALNTVDRWYVSAPGPIVVDGRLKIPATGDYFFVGTQTTYDLRDSELVIRMAAPNTADGSTSAAVSLISAATPANRIDIGFDGGSFYASLNSDTATTATYDPAHKWLRVALTDTTLTWATSPDAATWTTLRTATVPPGDYADLEIQLSAGNWASLDEATAGAAYFDRLNLAIDTSALTVAPSTEVTIVGSDAGGPVTSRTFTQTAGPTVTLSGTGATRTFTTPATAGDLTFAYTATDPDGSTASQIITVTVAVLPPRIMEAANFIWDPIPNDPPLDPDSATWTATFVAAADPAVLDLYAYGVPIYEIPADGTAPSYDVTATVYGTGTYPMRIPDDAAPSPESDGAMVVIDRPLGLLYEVWQAVKTGGTWAASSCAIYPLGSTGRGDATQGGGVTGWGVSRALGLATRGELESAVAAGGNLGHALTFGAPFARPSEFRYPAVKTDGANLNGGGATIPEGARCQLDPAFDVEASALSPLEKVIARTLQTYGAYLIDNAGGVALICQGNDPDSATPPTDPGDPTAAGGWANALGAEWDYYGINLPWESLRWVLTPTTHTITARLEEYGAPAGTPVPGTWTLEVATDDGSLYSSTGQVAWSGKPARANVPGGARFTGLPQPGADGVTPADAQYRLTWTPREGNAESWLVTLTADLDLPAIRRRSIGA